MGKQQVLFHLLNILHTKQARFRSKALYVTIDMILKYDVKRGLSQARQRCLCMCVSVNLYVAS